jgi:nucleoid-associated protein YgaU
LLPGTLFTPCLKFARRNRSPRSGLFNPRRRNERIRAMRKDVKAGMVLAIAVVLIAGWYYARDDQSQDAIPLDPVVQTPPADAPQSAASRDEDAADPGRAGYASLPLRSAQTRQAVPDTAAREGTYTVGGYGTSGGRDAGVARGERAAAPVAIVSDGTVLEIVELYTVQPQDTLSRLAEVYYGKRDYAELILRANPEIRNPSILRAGSVVRLPAVPAGGLVIADTQPATTATTQVAATPPNAAQSAMRTYTVQSGDSFYAIAERLLGSGARWPEILNSTTRWSGRSASLASGDGVARTGRMSSRSGVLFEGGLWVLGFSTIGNFSILSN